MVSLRREAMIKKIRCANPACRCHFIPNPRVKNQKYCGKAACQRVRKTLWQRRKMKADPDYKQNQRDSHKNWLEEHPGYWKKYRERHPDYVKSNLKSQKTRDERRRRRDLANMDALNSESRVKAGCYYIVSGEATRLAKMDASYQKIHIILDV